MIIAIDIDGCLADFNARFAELAGRPGDVPDCFDYRKAGWVDDAQFADIHDRVLAQADHLELLDDGAAQAIDEAIRAGHEVIYITSRKPLTGLIGVDEVRRRTRGFLQVRGLPDLPLVMAADKTRIGAEVFIDDSPDTARDLAAAGRSVVLIDWPYNRGVDAPRHRSVTEALAAVTS